MCKRLRHIFLLSVLFTVFSVAKGQQSMLQDVDYALLQKLVQTAKTNYPRVKQLGHRILANQAIVAGARAAWFDIFNFSYLYSPNNSTTLVNPSLFNGYQIGVSINIGSILQKTPNIRRAKEELYMAEEEKAEYMLSLESLVKQRYFAYVQQLAVIRLRISALTDLEQLVKSLQYKYEKGEVELDDYNRSLNSLADQTISKISAESAFLIAKTSLEEILGKPLEEVK
jgi:outer membrane protein TolC